MCRERSWNYGGIILKTVILHQPLFDALLRDDLLVFFLFLFVCLFDMLISFSPFNYTFFVSCLELFYKLYFGTINWRIKQGYSCKYAYLKVDLRKTLCLGYV